MPQQATQDARQQILELIGAGRDAEAVPLLLHACTTIPTNAEAPYLLGCSLAKLGRWADAIAALKQCIQIRADIPQSHFALAGALIATGEQEAAATCLSKALSLNSGMIEARLALVEILIAREDYSAANEHLQRALTTHPRMSKVSLLMGQLEQASKDYKQAEGYLRHAVEQDPHSLPALCALGTCLSNLGRHQEAETVYRTALEIAPHHIDARSGLALVYEYIGEHTKAIALIDPLLGETRRETTLALAFARMCKQMGRCDEAVDYIDDTLTRPDLSRQTRATLHFDAGKALDRMEQYDAAFAHYKAGNDAVAHFYDAAGNAALIDDHIQTFTPELYFRLPRATQRDGRPVFIVGMPRSGTTLTEQILAAHPAVYAAGELRTLSDSVEKVSRSLGGNNGFPSCVNSFRQSHVDSIASEYLDYLGGLSQEAQRITDKMPHNFYLLGLIQVLFPDAHVIHCHRDPLDTCLSIYFQNFTTGHEYAGKLFDIGVHYHQYLRIMNHWKQVLSLPILDIQYETLVIEPETSIHRMLDFCGLEWKEDCLQFHKLDRIIETSSYDQVRRPMYTDSIGRWRHYKGYLGDLKEGLERGY